MNTVDILKAAKARDNLLHIHAYCDATNCPSRHVTIYVKDFDDDLLPLVRRRDLRCPLCGALLQVHHVRTAVEQNDEDARLARENVNQQMYVRDHCPPGGLEVYPLALRNDLPPTPPGWWQGRDSTE